MSEQQTFQVAEFKNPLTKPTNLVELVEGENIIDILRKCDVDSSAYMSLRVTISNGPRSAVVPMDQWRRVRPRMGTHVLITPELHGPVVAALLSAVVATQAVTIAGALFPTLAAGSFGLAVATAAVSVVGSLLIRALIPPPKQQGGGVDDPTYRLSKASNRSTPGQPYPVVIGRHIMLPVKTATGFTETVGKDIYLRERMTFGYGPVALEELKIGTTLLKDFDDVEVEFLNVDQALTEAAMPELTNGDITVRGWRSGSEAMTIYPDDVAEDTYSVLLEQGVPVTRNSRVGAESASVDVSFDQLGTSDNKGRKVTLSATHTFEFRLLGDTTWTLHKTLTWSDNTTVFHRFSVDIPFPVPGEYELRITRTDAFHTDDSRLNGGTLTAVRSIQSGGLPSHPEIAEIAIRLKASEELNGTLDSLNAVVRQIARVWNGTTFDAPAPIRHPAWAYLRALTGPMLRDPVADSRIMLDELKSWADEEPHWQCDMVLTGPRRLADVLDLIAATGRARRGMSDLKYSVIRDGGAGGIVQHFTPENSWGFTGRRFLDREIHAFRVKTVSERRNWDTEEILVYADGFNSGNATQIETLELPGVILDANDGDQGNPWRIGRYHIAVAQLRSEEFHFFSDLDHMVCQMGDKIRMVHDVPLFGVGSGRTTSSTTTTMTLDEEVTPGTYTVRIRKDNGNFRVRTATVDAAGLWTFTASVANGPGLGALVMIEETTSVSVEMLITGIHHMGELQAKLTCVPAAPAVLDADTGAIPAYNPNITLPLTYGPTVPVVLSARSGFAVAVTETDLSLTPRIGVTLGAQVNVAGGVIFLQIRWRTFGSTEWVLGTRVPYQADMFTDRLEIGVSYDVDIASFDAGGNTRGWVSAAISMAAHTNDNPLPAPTGWVGFNGVESITLTGNGEVNLNRDKYRIYAATAGSAVLVEIGTVVTPVFNFSPGATGYTRYKVASVDFEDREGALTPFIAALPTGVTVGDLAPDVQQQIDDAQADATQGIVDAGAAQTTINNLLVGYTGTTLEASIDDVEFNLAPLVAGPVREPAVRWTTGVQAEYLPSLTKPAAINGTFITNDADFGDCYEFASGANTSFGPSYPVEFVVGRVYLVETKAKVVNDGVGGTPGARLHLGITVNKGTTRLQSNVQNEFLPIPVVADGVVEHSVYVSTDSVALSAYGPAAGRTIALDPVTNAAGNYFYSHVRQNSTGTTAGQMRIGSITITDVTDVVIASNDLSASITTIEALDVAGLAGTSLAGLVTQLDVDAGGVSATLTTTLATAADLDGFSAAFAGITVDTSGGDIAGFRATSFTNPDGSGGGVLELLGDVIVENSLATNKLLVGIGKNLLENSDLINGFIGVGTVLSGDVGTGGTVVLRNDGNYSETYSPSIRSRSIADLSSAGFIGVFFAPPLDNAGGALSNGYLVSAGSFYEFTARMSIRRVRVQFRIYWFDTTGAALAGADEYTMVDEQTVSGTVGNSDMTDWLRYGGIAVAPAGAKYSRPEIRIVETLGSAPDIEDVHIRKPMFAETSSLTDALSPYGPGGTTLIDGGRIITDTLIVNQAMIEDASIGRAQVEDVIASTDYAEDSNGNPLTGIELDFLNGGIKATNIILSRNIVVASGSFTFTGHTAVNGSVWNFVNTGIRVGVDDVWQAQKTTLMCVAAITSTVAISGSDYNNSFWAVRADLQPGARWNGFPGTAPTLGWQKDPSVLVDLDDSTGTDQRVYMRFSVDMQGTINAVDPKIDWVVYRVT